MERCRVLLRVACNQRSKLGKFSPSRTTRVGASAAAQDRNILPSFVCHLTRRVSARAQYLQFGSTSSLLPASVPTEFPSTGTDQARYHFLRRYLCQLAVLSFCSSGAARLLGFSRWLEVAPRLRSAAKCWATSSALGSPAGQGGSCEQRAAASSRKIRQMAALAGCSITRAVTAAATEA